MVRRRSKRDALRRFLMWGGKGFKLMLKAIPAFVLIAMIGVLVSGIHKMLHADPYFQISRVTVFPTGVLTNAEYRFLEETTRGRSLLDVDLPKVSEILERNPRVKRAEVKRVFPQELSVVITPRLPLVQVQFGGKGEYFQIARDQVLVAKQMSPDPELIILEDYSNEKKSPLVGRIYQNKHFFNLTEVLNFIANDPLFQGERVTRLAIDQLGNWSIILSDGVEIKVGKELRLSERQRLVLKALLQSSERAGLAYVDARRPDVVVKRK